MTFMPTLRLSALTLLTATFALSAGAAPRAPLPPEARTNGDETTRSLSPLRDCCSATVARFLDPKGRTIVTGTCLGRDGYFVTKASELPDLRKARLILPDGRMSDIREVRRDAALDLVVVHAIDARETCAVEPVSGAIGFGQWLAAPADGGRQFRIGVASAKTRQIKGYGAALGVRMDDDRKPAKGGVRITGIAEDGPAARAGLQENDVLVSLGGEPVGQYQRVNEIMTKRQPGEEIAVRFRRGSKENETTVRLASRTKVLSNWDGEDFANGGVSIRTDNFSQVLQHDLPLSPADMGGPLLNLEGQVIGINIARVDRVTTFALPTDAFWPTVRGWIENDRHPPKAVIAATAEPVTAKPVSAPAPESRGPRATLHQAR
jgi:S1-C subfamily serine protease